MGYGKPSKISPTTARTADLLSRYLEALHSADGKPVPTGVMLELLRLDTLDWKMDHGLPTGSADVTGPLVPPQILKAS